MLIEKLMIVANIVLCLSMPLTALAAEAYEPKFEYGEMKDGLFVRTLDEELESVPEDIYWEERAKAIEARKLDELTPEMKAAGYILVNGSVILMTDEGDSPEYNGKGEMQNHDSATGFITFSGVVESIIDEPIYISIVGVDDTQFYETYPIFKENNWISTVTLPIGKYEVVSGGIANDFKSQYPLQIQNEINIEENANCVVYFIVGNTNTIISEKTEIQDPIEETKEVEVPEKVEKTEDELNIVWLIVGIAVFVFIVLGGFYCVKKAHKYLS